MKLRQQRKTTTSTNHKRRHLWRRCSDGISHNILTQILDVIQSDVVLHSQVHYNCDYITFVIFIVCKNEIYMNSGLTVLPKGLRCSILSKITARMLTVRDRTADDIYCADVTFFLHETSDRLSLTAAFSLRRFLAFHCFKCYFASFSRYKTVFLPNIMPPKHAEQDQIDAKWLGKK